jgi:hypothetical protein
MSGTNTYKSWVSMKRRCSDVDSKDYKNYGGRGIAVCAEWQSDFSTFLRDMGECPKGSTLERIDNERGYSPDNCVWADKKTQSRNRRYTVLSIEAAAMIRAAREGGETLSSISKRFGISLSHVHRVAKGEAWAS